MQTPFVSGKEGTVIAKNNLALRLTPAANTKTVLVGFDGYIDSILKVRRHSGQNGDSFFNTLGEFGRYIEGKGGRSGSLELNLQTEKIGGNMPIFAQALSQTELRLTCVGAMGYPDIEPLFQPLQESCELITVCSPGTCQALEFDDGKLMLARNEEIEKLDFKMLEERVGIERLIALAEKADLLAFLNWSELRESTSIWKGFLSQVLPKLTPRKRRIFVDLSDCSHRSREDIVEMVSLLKAFTVFLEVSLSLNQNEAECIFRALGFETAAVDKMAQSLYREMGPTRLILHLVDSSYCVDKSGVIRQQNRYIEKPLLSTGGGDNFNAGFVLALLNDFDPEDCMAVANAFSGYYVSHGKSPSPCELAQWIEEEDISDRGGFIYEGIQET